MKLSNLTELKMKNNGLTRIPFAIRRMKTLRNLYLSGNRLESLPKNVSRMTFDVFDVSGPEMFPQKSAMLLNTRTSDAQRQPKSLLYLVANVVLKIKYAHPI